MVVPLALFTPFYTSFLSPVFAGPLARPVSPPAFLHRHLGILVNPIPLNFRLAEIPVGCVEGDCYGCVVDDILRTLPASPPWGTCFPEGPGKNQRWEPLCLMEDLSIPQFGSCHSSDPSQGEPHPKTDVSHLLQISG